MSERSLDAGIALAPGAEHNPLAVWFRRTLDGCLTSDARRVFLSLRAAVAVVAFDQRASVTLRFDHGHLAIHDGMLGVPDVTFGGDRAVLESLASLSVHQLGRLALPAIRGRARGRWRSVVVELVSGELKIYGLLTHPRTVYRFLRCLSHAS